MLSVLAIPRESNLRLRVQMLERKCKIMCWDGPFYTDQLCYSSMWYNNLMTKWHSSGLMYKIINGAQYCWNKSISGCFVFMAFFSCSLFSVNLFEILLGFKPFSLSAPLSLFLSRTHMLTWSLGCNKVSKKIAVHFDPHWMEASFSGCWQLNQPASHWWVSDYFQSTSQYVSAVIECQHPCPMFSWPNVMAFLFCLINDIWNNTDTFQQYIFFFPFHRSTYTCSVQFLVMQLLWCTGLNKQFEFFV